jgi:hypothetical protein
MTDATTGANKTAKHSASPLGMPNYEMPKFDLPKMEMPEAFREMAEKGVAQAKLRTVTKRSRRPPRKQRTSSRAPIRRPPMAPQTTTARS